MVVDTQQNNPAVAVEDVQDRSIIQQAIAAAERLEKANLEMRTHVAKLEELKAYEKLGGLTQGKPAEQPKIEESPLDYAKRALKGDFSKK